MHLGLVANQRVGDSPPFFRLGQENFNESNTCKFNLTFFSFLRGPLSKKKKEEKTDKERYGSILL